ncbi:MAG: hypothetical protein WA988_02275 [Candidatus Nanopelagicales bacterium]
MLIKVNKRTGKVTAVASTTGAKAKIRIQAVPVRAPYNASSSVWTRTWRS